MYQNRLVLRIPKNAEPIISPTIIISILNIIVCIVSFSACFEARSEIRIVVLLPIIYALLFSMIRRRIYLLNPGILTLNFVSFMRYAVAPLVILLTNELNVFSRTYLHLTSAVIVMIIEMIGIFFMVLVYNPMPKRNLDVEIRFAPLVKLLALVAALLLVIDNRSLIGNLSISTGLSALESNDINATSGLVTIVWQALSAFIFCFIMRNICENSNRRKIIFLSLLTCLVYFLIIYTGQATISRWHSIVTLIAIGCWLVKLYPDKKASIIICVGVPAVFVLIVATILKNTTVGLGAGFSQTFSSIFNATNMDTYFAGPVNVNTAIAVKETSRIGLNSLPYDVLNNFPYVNHLIDRSKASVNVFNAFLGRGDQIIPLVGQSFIWFGYLFTPLLSCVSVMIVKKMDAYFQESDSIKTYLYAFFAVWSALMPILNMTIWLSWVYSRVFPAFLLFNVLTRRKCASDSERSNG